MSYTPDELKIEKSVENILEGIKEFNKCAELRMESGDYSHSHVIELFDIKHEFLKWQLRLHKLL